MGSIIGGVIGGIGSLVGGSSSSDASKKASGLDLTGYNYLTKGAGAPTIQAAQGAGIPASGRQSSIQGTEGALLGQGGDTAAANTAFNNYLNSTGYQFQLDQGSKAITGNAASRGLLNSGSTAKALEGYGQNLASGYFNNYLNQLSGLNQQAYNTAGQGINATVSAGSAGTQGGVAAGQNTQAGGDAMGNAIATGAGVIGGTVANNWPTISNYFAGG